MFLISALSLAGLPPLSGFIGKLGLMQAGFDAGRWIVVSVSLVASLLTLFSMTKIWSGVFWGEPSSEDRDRFRRGMIGATVALVAFSGLIAIAGEPLFTYAERAASELLDVSGYRDLVLGAAP